MLKDVVVNTNTKSWLEVTGSGDGVHLLVASNIIGHSFVN